MHYIIFRLTLNTLLILAGCLACHVVRSTPLNRESQGTPKDIEELDRLQTTIDRQVVSDVLGLGESAKAPGVTGVEISNDGTRPMPLEGVGRSAEERDGSNCPTLPDRRRRAWAMCYGIDETDGGDGTSKRWVMLYTHEGAKVMDYVIAEPGTTDLAMWTKAADLLGCVLQSGTPEVGSRRVIEAAMRLVDGNWL